jgi:hypothetical protein
MAAYCSGMTEITDSAATGGLRFEDEDAAAIWQVYAAALGGAGCWTARVEVRTAAADAVEADLLLADPRMPLDRAGRRASEERETLRPGERGQVEEVTEGLDEAAKSVLEAGYPPAGPPWDDQEVQDWYVNALRIAGLRRSRPPGGPVNVSAMHEYGALLDGRGRRGRPPERYWRSVWIVRLLARDHADARQRAGEMATTVVDWAGLPAGAVRGVDQGFGGHEWEAVELEHAWQAFVLGGAFAGTPQASASALRAFAEQLESMRHRQVADTALREAMRARAQWAATQMPPLVILSTARHLERAADEELRRVRDARSRIRALWLRAEAGEYLRAGGFADDFPHEDDRDDDGPGSATGEHG